MSDSDFFSFDKALDKLSSLEEEDLKRLISAGEIRAFRDGSKMRLRAEDVDRVAGDLGFGDPISEEDAGEVFEVEEVSFEEDTDAGMVTTQLSEEDTLLDDGVDEVVIEEEGVAATSVAGRRSSGRTRATAATADLGGVGEIETTGMRAALILTTLIMAYGIAFLFAMHVSQSSGVTRGLVDMMSK